MKRLALALVVLTACDDKKPTPPATPSATVAASSVAPKELASTAPSATASVAEAAAPPAVDSAALLALHVKYEAPAKELVAAVRTAVAAEKKKQAAGGEKFTRLPMPATKLSKDASVVQVLVPYSDDLYTGIHALNPLPRAGSGNAAKIPSADEVKVSCPSEYTNDPAADLTYKDGATVVIVVKTDACKAADAPRDAQIERAKKLAEPRQEDLLAHLKKVPAVCVVPTGTEPEISPELKKAGFVKARLSCRDAKRETWASYGVNERKYDRKGAIAQPAWRPTLKDFKSAAFFLTDDPAHGKPFELTFIGTRADDVEIESLFYLE